MRIIYGRNTYHFYNKIYDKYSIKKLRKNIKDYEKVSLASSSSRGVNRHATAARLPPVATLSFHQTG